MPEERISPAVIIIPVALGLAAVAVIGIAAMAKAAPTPPAEGYANLYGKVSDAASGKAISGVLVALDNMTTFTDPYGNYTLANIPVGSYTATFSKAGYETAVY